MSICTSFQSIKSVNTYRKPIGAIAILVITMGISVACGKEFVADSKDAFEVEVLSKHITGLVKGLEYSNKVGGDFAKMVISWKGAEGRPVIFVWKKKLAEAKENYKRGKISKAQLATAEQNIAKELVQRIDKEISINDEVFDLADVVKYKQAQCLGYSQVLYILANSIGLVVKPIDVSELLTGEFTVHTTCIIGQTDGRTIMLDLAQTPVPLISKPFELNKELKKVGNYWELKDKSNPLKLHRRIRILNRYGLIAGIYLNRGVAYAKQGKYAVAISNFNKAIELDPDYADAYFNRGAAYDESGQSTKAFSDYNKAIQLNPRRPEAYYNRGTAYRDLEQYERALLDFTEAIKLNPKFVEAYLNRGRVYEHLGQPNKAIADFSKAYELEPKPAKIEPMKLPAPKLEPIKLPPAKLEPLKLPPAKIDPIKFPPPKLEPIKLPPAKLEPLKLPPAKLDPIKLPAPKLKREDIKLPKFNKTTPAITSTAIEPKKPFKVSASSPKIEVLSKEIKKLVKGLEYSDKVAEDFDNMVGDWKDEKAQPVLVGWKRKLVEAKEDYEQGKISKEQFAKIELSIIKELSQRIQKEIVCNKGIFDLADAVKNKQANNLGYSQLLYLLCNCAGLSVQMIIVEELMIPAPLPEAVGHVACIVGLTDGRAVMTDLVPGGFVVSSPFIIEKEFAKVGNYLELKDKVNLLGIHRRIQILDSNGVLACRYLGTGYAYHKRGRLGEAIAFFNTAILLNPKDARAYFNRGVTYASLEKFKEAKKDLLKAVKLESALKAKVKKISDQFKLDLDLNLD